MTSFTEKFEIAKNQIKQINDNDCLIKTFDVIFHDLSKKLTEKYEFLLGTDF